MKTVKTVKGMQRLADQYRAQGKRIGLVPTMGFLHAGHLSLVRAAHKECDVVVVSIFVNPTQFGPREDFGQYPRNLQQDRRALRAQGYCDVIFAPPASRMYPAGYSTYVTETRLSAGLCGKSRPGHFRGVTTVVEKLFNCVKPHLAVFGQKDYQQARVIKRMVTDLNQDIKIKVTPIVRESGGLAMSSRNTYLNNGQREAALVLNRALKEGRDLLIRQRVKDTGKAKRTLRTLIGREPKIKLEYLEIVDAHDLEPRKNSKRELVIALAARVGKTRLIDNILVKVN